MQALLLYNPAAGRNRDDRLPLVKQVARVLCERGLNVEVEATYARGSAQQQSREALQRGTEVVFACGGDGTVHDVLQGISGTDALLGIVPAGSANVLAQELKLTRDPVRAVDRLSPEHFRQFRTTLVQRPGLPPLYSLCMTGAGPAALLMYRMLGVSRSSIGRWRYYEHALRVFLSHRFPPFELDLLHAGGTQTHHRAVSAMTLRVGDLGGIFAGIAQGASLDDETLHALLVAPPARLTLPLWIFLSWLGLGRFHPGVTVANAIQLRCHDVVPLQVDGEWAGGSAPTISSDGPLQRVLVPH